MTRGLHLLVSSGFIACVVGCTTPGKAPPEIVLDQAPPVAMPTPPDPPPASPAVAPVEVVAVPAPLPLPSQLKALPDELAAKAGAEPADEKARVARANEDARIAPAREGYVNAIQVWPYADGALYQVYTSPGRVTVVALEPGEELVTVSAGDTVRWIVGDTASGSGTTQRVNILVKPTRAGLRTNLVVSTNRRTYLLELTATPQAWMASVSWDYPRDRLLALQRQARDARREAPVAAGVALEQLRFRYAITGDNPAWRPLRAFDDGQRVYVQFPDGIAQGELPPLFVIGPKGDAQLVNYRFRSPYYVIDRLFGAAELRLGGDKGQAVRIERNDVVAARPKE